MHRLTGRTIDATEAQAAVRRPQLGHGAGQAGDFEVAGVQLLRAFCRCREHSNAGRQRVSDLDVEPVVHRLDLLSFVLDLLLNVPCQLATRLHPCCPSLPGPPSMWRKELESKA